MKQGVLALTWVIGLSWGMMTSVALAMKSNPQVATVIISPQSQQLANIKVDRLKPQKLPLYLSAPGEVIPDLNNTAIVTPRVQSQALKRFVQVGEQVQEGQPLVTLTSVKVADTQAALLFNAREFDRLKELGYSRTTAKRYNATETAFQKAYAQLLAYGMTEKEIDALLKQNDPRSADGEYTLLAPRPGTVLESNFSEGQMIKPGQVLFRIVNEDSLWVDARVTSGDVRKIKPGTAVIVKVNGHRLKATVLQKHHQLEASTRAHIIRIAVKNPQDLLHPRQFVTCLIKTGSTPMVLAVPRSAIVKTSSGLSIVYEKLKANTFRPIPVTVKRVVADRVIIDGVSANTELVVQGAFFIYSEQQKNKLQPHLH